MDMVDEHLDEFERLLDEVSQVVTSLFSARCRTTLRRKEPTLRMQISSKVVYGLNARARALAHKRRLMMTGVNLHVLQEQKVNAQKQTCEQIEVWLGRHWKFLLDLGSQ